MNTAQEHALEQANLIAQLVKYADRLIVIESASPPERHDFVELVAERLPDSVETLIMAAESDNLPQEIIPLVTQALQLSPGIEAPRQLATAVHEALSAQGRMLVIIENVDAWLETESWPELLIMLRAAHELAPNHLLFMLTGEIDLTEHLRTEPELTDMQSDIHQCLLLDAAFADTVPESKPETAQKPAANRESPKEEALVASLKDPKGRPATPPPGGAPRRPFNPTLLIIAALSVAVVSFGGFALLTRTSDTGAHNKSIPLEPTPATSTIGQTTPEPPPAPVSATTPTAQTGNPLPNDGEAGKPTTGPGATSVAAETPAPHLEPVPAQQPPNEANSAAATPHLPAIDTANAPQAVAAPAKPEKVTPEKTVQTKPTPKPTPANEARKHTPPHHQRAVESAKVPATDNAWYLAQPKHHATIQLGAFTDTQAALRFIRKHETGTRLTGWHIFAQKPKNQTLYTVTLGDFTSLSEARKAIEKLPEPLRRIKPYPRTYNAIDQVLAK